MFKKSLLLTLLLALLMPWAAKAQSLFSEDFEGGSMPTGWTTDGNGTWSVATAVNSTHPSSAGNGTYCAQITHGTTGNATKLITPEIDLSSVTSAELSFMHVHQDWYGDNDELKVYYRTSSSGTWTLLDGQDYANAYESWTTEEGIVLPNLSSTYQIAFEYVDHYGYGLGIDYVQIVRGASCVKPNGLAATLTPGDGTIATLDWTAGGTETAWVLEYGTAADFTGATSVNVSGTPTKNLTGLTPETTYYARVKADCGGGDQSDWCNDVCSFTPTDAYLITVNDGTSTNEYVPFYGYYADSNTDGLFIIPAASLASIQWGTITSLTFYVQSPASSTFTNSSGVSAEFEVYMSETTETTISGTTISFDGMTKVLNATNLVIDNNMMEITLDTPFEYLGGNLMIGFDETTNGGYAHTYWYGIEATGASLGGYGTSIAQKNFLPKTTFGFIPGTAPSCFTPTYLDYSNVTANTVDLSWTENGAATEWVVGYSTDGVNFREVAATTNPFTLTGLDPETDYFVKVQADCGGGDLSNWSTTVSFTTDELCHTPTYVEANDITATSAKIEWDNVESTYTLRYAAWPSSKGASSPIKFADVVKNMDYKATDLTNAQVTAAPNAQPNSNTNPGQTRDGWYYYDNGTHNTSFGYNGQMFWGVMFPAGTYTGNVLSKISVYENADNNTQPITVYVCDGTTAPDNILYMEEFDVAQVTGFHEVTLASPVSLDPTQNFWLIFYSADNYPAAVSYASTETDANGRWCSFDGGTWYDLADVGGDAYYAFMARAYTETLDFSSVNWTTVNNITTNEYVITGLTPETRYVAQVRSDCTSNGNGTSYWVTTYFFTLPSCLVPTNLDYSEYTAHTVTLGWTENGEATAWDIEVTGPTTYIVNATTNPFTVSGLAENTTYSFKVRAKCSDTDFSDWSNHVTVTTDIACYAPENLVMGDIDGFSANLTWVSSANSCELRYAVAPDATSTAWLVYDNDTYATSIGSSSSSTRTWGVMYPATMLGGNNVLSTLKFYETGTLESYITINIYQGGTTAPSTLIYTGVANQLNAEGWHTVALSDAVTIDPTQNLWISLTATGVYPMPACLVNDENNRWVIHDGVWEQLTSNLADYGWMIRAYLDNLNWVDVPGITTYDYTMDNLNPLTDYIAQVRSDCEDVNEGYSWWSDVNFTTLEACPTPANLTAEAYANSALLEWTGSSDSYTVSYRTSTFTLGTTEEFGSSAPTGWTRYNTLLNDDVLNGNTALTSYNGGWNFGTSNGVFDNHARVNVYGTCNYWLVTPATTVDAGGQLSFDLALTAYSGTLGTPATTGTDDRFVVLISTDDMATWRILRQWDNAGSTDVYNNITCSATGEKVFIDLSSYESETVYIAFYGESTTSNADNNLHIDNVAIGVVVPAGEWRTETVNEPTIILSGLTAETKYDWKVQGDCDSNGISNESVIMSFTTTNDLCPVPTNLAADNITYNSANISWSGSTDVTSFTVRYRASEHVVGGLSETFEANSVPTGWTRYSGLVDDVVAGTATLTTTTSGWAPTTYALGSYNMKVNIWGTSVKYWLVTPEVTPTNGTFTFDLALTDYGNADPIEDATAQADDRFVVLVYADNAWTILREWNNSGSSYVYNTIATTGEAVSIDLSAYVGKLVKIAFYGESTASGGDNDLHIDNVVIGNPTTIPATDWETVTTTDMNVTLEGLTPKTPYEAQVKSDCSDPEVWSNVYTFNTADLPSATINLLSGKNWFSTNLEITLNDLKAALEATGLTGTIKIKSKTQTTTYNGSSWRGALTWDVARMYIIDVPADCQITLSGMPINPDDHPVNIVPGTNWIAFPLNETMQPGVAFAGFGVKDDMVKSKNGSTKRLANGSWRGTNFPGLEPWNGYLYNSAATENRTLVFPTSK